MDAVVEVEEAAVASKQHARSRPPQRSSLTQWCGLPTGPLAGWPGCSGWGQRICGRGDERERRRWRGGQRGRGWLPRAGNASASCAHAHAGAPTCTHLHAADGKLAVDEVGAPAQQDEHVARAVRLPGHPGENRVGRCGVVWEGGGLVGEQQGAVWHLQEPLGRAATCCTLLPAQGQSSAPAPHQYCRCSSRLLLEASSETGWEPGSQMRERSGSTPKMASISLYRRLPCSGRSICEQAHERAAVGAGG